MCSSIGVLYLTCIHYVSCRGGCAWCIHVGCFHTCVMFEGHEALTEELLVFSSAEGGVRNDISAA